MSQLVDILSKLVYLYWTQIQDCQTFFLVFSISLQISNCTSNCELKDVEREKRHEHFTPWILFSSFHLFAAAAAAARLFSAFFFIAARHLISVRKKHQRLRRL